MPVPDATDGPTSPIPVRDAAPAAPTSRPSVDLASARALFLTAEVTSDGEPGTDALFGQWLERKLHMAFYRAADERLIVRGIAPEEPIPGRLFSARYGRAQLEDVYLTPAGSTKSPAAEPTGSEADGDNPGEEELDWEDDPVPGVAPAAEALLRRHPDGFKLSLGNGGRPDDAPVLVMPVGLPDEAVLAPLGDTPGDAWLGAARQRLWDAGYELLEGWERIADGWRAFIRASHVPDSWGWGGTELDQGPYAQLAFDDDEGWGLFIDPTGNRSLAARLAVWLDVLQEVDEDPTEWDTTYFVTLIESALHTAGYRIDFTRPSQRYHHLAVEPLRGNGHADPATDGPAPPRTR